MGILIENSWKKILDSEFKKPYFLNLVDYVKTEYQNHRCYPKGSQIFNAFKFCPVENVKVVIIGQDPYVGVGQANGLCFSVNDPLVHPPSLRNILKEVEQDTGIPYPNSGNLERWANQGVLLLNSILTVRKNEIGSHKGKGWETFTDAVISNLSKHKKSVIYMLWGAFAKNKARLIERDSNFILTSGHPSPMSANRGLWFGNKHFSRANDILKKQNLKPILW